MGKLKGKNFPTVEVTTALGVTSSTAPVWGDLKINKEDLNQEMTVQPGLYAHYAALAVEASAHVKTLRYKLHCMREDLDKEFRSSKDKEAAIKARINRHPKMRALYTLQQEAVRKASLLAVLKDAFQQRKEMLQSIGANNRNDRDQSKDLNTLKRRVTEKLQGKSRSKHTEE